VNIWWAQTINPKIPIEIIAKIILIFLKISIFPISCDIICDIIPNPGKIKIYTSGWPKNQNKCW
jgi:hypothetical protein